MSNVVIDLTKTVKEIIPTMKTAIDNLNTDVSSRPVYYLDSDGCLCEKIFVEVTE
jgi:hypothetical protein